MMYKKIFLAFLASVVFLTIQHDLYVQAATKDSVTISTRNNALNAAVKFLHAQKNCKVDEMIQYSNQVQNIADLSGYYQSICEEHPLQKAEVTDLVVVSNELGLVSTKLDYPERSVIQISPVIRLDGKWKFVKGYKKALASSTTNGLNPEFTNVLDGYFNSVGTGDKEELDKFSKDLSKDGQYNEGLANKKELNSLRYNVNQFKLISDKVAIASIETKIGEKFNETIYVIYKENDKWKIISDRTLVTASIPKGPNPVKVE